MTGRAASLRAPRSPRGRLPARSSWRSATLALASAAFGLAAGLAATGCTSNHHVSPWGQGPGVAFAAYVRGPDLSAELALVDAETAALGLRLTDEVRVELPVRSAAGDPGGPAALRGYVGRDAGGLTVHATRVATARGVVLAAGPLDVGDLDRRRATELCRTVPAIEGASGLVFRSGTDLNGDGTLDVVLRNDAGELTVWHVGELGSGAYETSAAVPLTRGLDVDGDGRLDLWGQLPVEPGDPIAPRLTDVATFDAGTYSDATAPARAWHAQATKTAEAQAKQDATAPTRVTDAVRLRGAVERAWHAILAGEPRDRVLNELAREPVPQALRPSLDRYAGVLTSLPRR